MDEGNNKKYSAKMVLVSFTVGVLLCLSLCVTSTVRAQNPQKVEMSLEQFNSLRQMVTELQKQSTAQKQDSQKLKTQLTESQKELTKAQVYLTDYRQNLTTLQKQTDSLNKSVKRMERQRDLAWVVAGGLLIWGCSR